MKRITERSELVALAKELGVRPDWHEPDEQELGAEVHGTSFDNAGFWPADEYRDLDPSILEQYVILHQDGKPVAAVNLATLFAWATGYEAPTARVTLTEEEEEIVLKIRRRGN
jgi:hypothetical protein